MKRETLSQFSFEGNQKKYYDSVPVSQGISDGRYSPYTE
ncbi:hypothetical protein MNB_SV-10-331 [hydrothermal vent metagenome]|uniref:Uncharacterized protein n=1 Tax=hydrothermal vent metagenome TaxID=652676 RepID=A0A1W1CP53_9ZZZZ